MNKYSLPELPYNFDALAPFISEEQLKIHYEKHHLGYVNTANKLLETLENTRKDNKIIDLKSTLKSLSFNIAGHLFHSLFWPNLSSAKQEPSGKIKDVLESEFGSIEQFKKEFSDTAASVEGSGWAVLAFCKKLNRPIIMQIEKHNVNVIPMFNILLVLDVWEHAYYLDYKNLRLKFIVEFWNHVNWEEVNNRLDKTLS